MSGIREPTFVKGGPIAEEYFVRPGSGATIYGSLSGIPVIVVKHLPETAIYHFPHLNQIAVGSIAHLRYEIAKAQLRIDLRADLERQLDAFARRVGVDRSTLRE